MVFVSHTCTTCPALPILRGAASEASSLQPIPTAATLADVGPIYSLQLELSLVEFNTTHSQSCIQQPFNHNHFFLHYNYQGC